MARRFVLLTAARNEALHLPMAIEAVAGQTVRPDLWIIVDDGSTDGTADVIRAAAAQHPFISLLSTGSTGPRCFGSKDRAIRAAYDAVLAAPFDFLAVQDADIAPGRPDLFAALLAAFERRPTLGIAGGYVHERHGGVWKSRGGNSPDAVAGGLQMFRRACYEQIGGYTPLHLGGEDWLAQLDAARAGWDIQVLTEQPVLHYRTSSSAGGHLRGLFRLGLMDASFGSHPVFEFLKCARRLGVKPIIAGGALRYLGYLWAKLSMQPLSIAPEKAAYLREQQTRKLRCWWKTKFMRARVAL